VNEVALALQFDRPAVDVEVLGLLAGRLKPEFPVQQQVPPLPPMEEPTGPAQPQFQVQLGAPPTFPRTWFSGPDGHQLVQVQSDRFALNWRRLGGEVPYPRYTFLHDLLTKLLAELREALDATGTDTPAVNFCELLYINEIVVPGVEPGQRHPDLSQIIRFVEPIAGPTFLPEAEDAQLQARWRMPAEALPVGAEIGRLYVAITPGLRPDTQLPIYLMHVTARIVPPLGCDLGAALDVLDVGHEWIVRGFADLTTDEMHKLWRIRT
jgi:uncharacterized protein (TIGR04255 family)